MRTTATILRRQTGSAPSPPPVYTPPVVGPLAWFDAGTESYVNAAAVPTASDRSGNVHDATQATGANRPSFATGVINSLPAYRFDGVNDMLQTAAIALAQPLNLFMVGKSAVDGVSQYFCDDAANGNSLAVFKPVGNTLNLWAGIGLTGPALDTTFHIIHGLFNSGTSVARLDGGSGTAGNVGTNIPSGITIGAYQAGLAFLNGDIAEYLLYGALSTSDVNAVGNYLAAKYALSWSPVP